MKTPVLTSKAAVNHYNDIMVQHDEILKGLKQQSERVKMYNDSVSQAEALEKQNTLAEEKERMTQDQKQQELDIKRLALTQ